MAQKILHFEDGQTFVHIGEILQIAESLGSMREKCDRSADRTDDPKEKARYRVKSEQLLAVIQILEAQHAAWSRAMDRPDTVAERLRA